MSKIIESYANSLYELEKGNKAILEELQTIVQAMDTEDYKLFASKLIEKEEKKAIINTTMKISNTYLKSFLYVLVDNDRLKLLPGITEYYELLVEKAAGIKRVYVTTATSLSEDKKSEIIAALKKNYKYKSIKLIEKVDPNIIQGMVVENENRTLDMSLLHKGQSLKKFLEK
ncbi:MAG: ATP synthase F1 subunit delta [Bacilli bacterium]